jgi:hypothetical protein
VEGGSGAAPVEPMMKKRESALAEKWVMVMLCFEFVIRGVWIDDILL